VDNSGAGAVYKGLALANTNNGPMLYAANFNTANIDVYDANLLPVTVAGGFKDSQLPAGYAPFNVQRIGRKLYVTYAMQDMNRHDDVAGAGNGIINVFDFQGNLLARLVSNGSLNSPWGLALAPGLFGDFSNALLVGNFGDGVINAFDPCSGEYLGTLQDSSGANIAISGLWGLSFGNGHGAGDANTLYFTAGISGSGKVEDHGLFGSIQPADAAPAPSPQPVTANIANFAFAPPTLTIAAGTQVQWTNQDAAAHTVAADQASFSSSDLQRGQTFSQTFSTPGTYSYHCSIHPFMKGTVVVK
jgi:plastocyanin